MMVYLVTYYDEGDIFGFIYKNKDEAIEDIIDMIIFNVYLPDDFDINSIKENLIQYNCWGNGDGYSVTISKKKIIGTE